MAIQELLSLSLLAIQNSRILTPYVELTLNNPAMHTQLTYMYNLVHKLSEYKCTEVPDFEEQFEKVFLRNELERQRADLRLKLSAEGLALYPEYVNRVNILKDLGYIDTDDRGIFQKPIFTIIFSEKFFRGNSSSEIPFSGQ